MRGNDFEGNRRFRGYESGLQRPDGMKRSWIKGDTFQRGTQYTDRNERSLFVTVIRGRNNRTVVRVEEINGCVTKDV